MLGICSCIGASRVDIIGLLNPIAEKKGIKGGIDNLYNKKTHKRRIEDHDRQSG